VVVEVAPLTGPVDDDVDRILSYDRVTESIAAAMAEVRLNLLETLAERVAQGILAAPQAVRVFIRIEKLDRGPGALGVEIVRSRDAAGPVAAQTSVPRPLVVFLDTAILAGPDLTGHIDRLAAGPSPLILCVGAAEKAAPRSASGLAQRRIDLLAIEQNAWVLAGRDERCIVVGSRTELDWAMRQRRISVWAPSKIVLDAVDGPAAGPGDALALATWFARQMNAVDLVVIGAEAG
jgi:7,8-dihydroneopterin aldolase/epimerase/oxygenase